MKLLDVTIAGRLPLSKGDEALLRMSEPQDVLSSLRAAGAKIEVTIKSANPPKKVAPVKKVAAPELAVPEDKLETNTNE